MILMYVSKHSHRHHYEFFFELIQTNIKISK
jgi:hypothetical protein